MADELIINRETAENIAETIREGVSPEIAHLSITGNNFAKKIRDGFEFQRIEGYNSGVNYGEGKGKEEEIEYASTATANAEDVLQTKTFYKNGQIINGKIPIFNGTSYTPGNQDRQLVKDQYVKGTLTIKGDGRLLPENIRFGKSIFGVNGTFCQPMDVKISNQSYSGEWYPEVHYTCYDNDRLFFKTYSDTLADFMTGTISQIVPNTVFFISTYPYSYKDITFDIPAGYYFLCHLWSEDWALGEIREE